MDDSLLSYEEADAIAREMCDDWIERDPDGARVSLRLLADAPIIVDESLIRRMAWVGMLKRAIEVRCERECDHTRRIAWLRCGLLACHVCMGERFADASPRDGANPDCDVCGAAANHFALIEHKIGPDGPYIIADACDACVRLWESLRLPPVPMSLN